MDFNIDVRRKQLKSLDQFIQSTHNNINSILKSLDWDAEKVLEEDTLVPCTLNPEHKVPANKIVEHIKKCSIRSEKYPENEVYLSEPLHHPDASIHLSKEEMVKILSGTDSKFKTAWKPDNPEPKTCDRIYSTYNPQERLLLYKYCAAKTKGPPELPEFNIYSNEPSSKELTRDEQLARHRDLKRRRMKYKKTFTSHKPPIEIMREVISGQMEMYEEWLKSGEEDRGTSGNKEEEQVESVQEGDKTNNEQIEYKNGRKVEESDNNCENSNRGYLEEESFELSSRNSSSSKNNHRRSDKLRDRSRSHETSFSDNRRRQRRSRSHHGNNNNSNNDDNGSHSSSSRRRQSNDRRHQTSDRRGDHNNGDYRSRSRHTTSDNNNSSSSKRRRNGGRSSRSTSRSKPYNNSRHSNNSNGNDNSSHRMSTSTSSHRR